jgi:hypothetical protein
MSATSVLLLVEDSQADVKLTLHAMGELRGVRSTLKPQCGKVGFIVTPAAPYQSGVK